MTTAKGFSIVLPLLLLLSFTGCSTVGQKQSRAEAQAVYSTQKAIEAGRFDLAQKYNAQAARLVSPPKQKPVVSPFIAQGKRYVVLPPAFNGIPTLAIDSPAADTLIQSDRALQGQLRAENKTLAKTERATDKVIKEKEKIVEKAETAKLIASHSFWGRVKFFGFIALLGGGIAALCYFFPPAIPIVLSLWHWLISSTWTIAQKLAVLIHNQFSRLKSK